MYNIGGREGRYFSPNVCEEKSRLGHQVVDPKTKNQHHDTDMVSCGTRLFLLRQLMLEEDLKEKRRQQEWKQREAELQEELEQLKREWKRQEAKLQEELEQFKSTTLSRKRIDLTKIKKTEEEKMMKLSTADYSPSKWLKVPLKQSEPVPPLSVCRRCHKPGHWVHQCTFTTNRKSASFKKAYRISRTMMRIVNGPEVPEAMLTTTGKFVIYASPLSSSLSTSSSITTSSLSSSSQDIRKQRSVSAIF
ncbi:hypothetical protein KQX54_008638 [Cotesia glomerata]|uniref:CCHC-type domain-containing protein n=1 Tax=Cotesia glomerata TaxID=32391 RepID=A0AAV7I4V6_COTGL|nr:hypothetical protein KQX54_008638 [Cotesia glomerata]